MSSGIGLLLSSLLATTAPEAERQRPEPAPSREATAVFMSLPGADPELEREAVEAMQAQLMGISARLVVREAGAGETMRERIDRALSLATEEAATAVFWIEMDSSGQLLHYTVEAGRGDRALVRRTGTDAGSRSAQLEGAAVITRRSTDALLRGAEIGVGFEEVRPEPVPADKPTDDAPATKRPTATTEALPRGAFRFALGYSGSTYAPEVPWQSGLVLRAGWRFPFGLLVDAGYTLTLPARRRVAGVELTVVPHPVEVAVGYQREWSRLAVAAELDGIVDYATRRTLSAERDVVTTKDDGRFVLGLAPRARLEFLATPVFRVFVSGGILVFPGAFAYVADLPERSAFLRPWRVRAQARAGIAFSL